MSYEHCPFCGGLVEIRFPGTHKCPGRAQGIAAATGRPPIWGPSPQEAEIGRLKAEITAIAEALNCCGQPILERIEEFYIKDRGKTQEINRLIREVRAQEAEIAALEAAPAALVDTALEDRIHELEAVIERVKAFAAKLKATEDTEWGWGVKREWGVRIEAALAGETP